MSAMSSLGKSQMLNSQIIGYRFAYRFMLFSLVALCFFVQTINKKKSIQFLKSITTSVKMLL